MPAKRKLTEDQRNRLPMLYARHANVHVIAKILECGSTTVWKELREMGISTSYRRSPAHSSSMAQWLLANPDVKLPRSIKKIQTLTGLSEDTIKCYFYRRRKKIERQALDVLQKHGLTFLGPPKIGKRDFTIGIQIDDKLYKFKDASALDAFLSTYVDRIVSAIRSKQETPATNHHDQDTSPHQAHTIADGDPVQS